MPTSALGVGRWALGVGRWALNLGRLLRVHSSFGLPFPSGYCFDTGLLTSDHGSRVTDHGSRISNLESRISDLVNHPFFDT
jgi:hypothetical protein